ncbi:hypothetical protein RRG08_001403 [Elysia crispata]|uniref:Uncharacterized protein n=1 Tax=Elysia crispata TaxID=231223 RepID=A0AAE0ZQY4_9GAST|nr:hypothetical protein RRG08_001403 [Elysia crispata]
MLYSYSRFSWTDSRYNNSRLMDTPKRFRCSTLIVVSHGQIVVISTVASWTLPSESNALLLYRFSWTDSRYNNSRLMDTPKRVQCSTLIVVSHGQIVVITTVASWTLPSESNALLL